MAANNQRKTMNSNSIICAALEQDTQYFVKAGDIRPHVVTKCNNIPLVCLYDTGSGPSLIRTTVLDALEKKAGRSFTKRDTKVKCKGAFNGGLQVSQKVMLNISAGGRSVNEEFLVARELSSGAIMGMGLIKKLGLRWHPESPTQLMEAEEEEVRLASSISIPAESCIVASCHLNGQRKGKAYVAEGLPNGPCDLPGTLFNADNTFDIPLYNLTAVDIVLPQNTVVARATPADTITPIAEAVEKICTVGGENNPLQVPKATVLTKEKQAALEEYVDLSHLSEEDRKEVLQLVLKHHDAFSSHKFDIGRARHHTHRITMEDKKPIYSKQWRLPQSMAAAINEHIKELTRLGIIKHASSRYNSAIFCVAKRSGALRVVVDYRKINAAATPHFYSSRTIDDCLNSLAEMKANLFSSLDLTSGYHQLPLAEDSQELTAFTVPGVGQFQYCVVPMGCQSAPAAFSAMMDEVTRGLTGVLTYLDDVVVASQGLPKHLQELEQVLLRLRAHNLKLNPSKCETPRFAVSDPPQSSNGPVPAEDQFLLRTGPLRSRPLPTSPLRLSTVPLLLLEAPCLPPPVAPQYSGSCWEPSSPLWPPRPDPLHSQHSPRRNRRPSRNTSTSRIYRRRTGRRYYS